MICLAVFSLQQGIGQDLFVDSDSARVESSTSMQNEDCGNTFDRYYEAGFANSYGLRTSSRNMLTVYKVTQDVFNLGLRPKLGKAGNFASGIWSFGTTYLALIWSHEFGHSLRARQVGGKFNIHNGRLPIPYTTMSLPEDATYEDQALSVTGGFEVNYLTALQIQEDFYAGKGLYNDELSLGLAHRLMYPIYISLIIPQDPSNPETWIKTGGDPVHYIKPVWQRYSGDQVFMADSTVNPGLVRFYNESAIFAVLWNFLDPAFYKEAKSFVSDISEGTESKFLVGDAQNGWTYGTMFNVTPLGYELHLNNYIKRNGKLIIGGIHYGRPYKNIGLSVKMNDLVSIKTDKLVLGGELSVWDQDIYGKGFAVMAQGEGALTDQLSVRLEAGYKTDGYMLGRPLNKGLVGWFGIRHRICRKNEKK